jgi:hypothetical protein
LKNLRVYSATPDTPPQEEQPPPGPRKYCSRRELAHWLAQELAGDMPTIVGIGSCAVVSAALLRGAPVAAGLDGLPGGLPQALAGGCAAHLRGLHPQRFPRGRGRAHGQPPVDAADGSAMPGGAIGVSVRGGQGKVAAATHAGLPWIVFLKRQLGERINAWPFDGWGSCSCASLRSL